MSACCSVWCCSRRPAPGPVRCGPGVFTIPDLMQVKVVRKPAVEEHKGINPFTKEEMIFKAKPAKNAVKLVPLKGLKALV